VQLTEQRAAFPQGKLLLSLLSEVKTIPTRESIHVDMHVQRIERTIDI